MDQPVRQRLATLERQFTIMWEMFDLALERLGAVGVHARALHEVLAAKGLIDDAEVANKMESLRAVADLELEYGPQHEDFRRIRRTIREAGPAPDDPDAVT